jgi:hypothetical protein
MISEETMSIGSKRELYQVVNNRYHRANKVEKGKILDEYSANAGLSRKYATRLLNEGYKRGKKKPGPTPRYAKDQEFLEALRLFWRTLNYPCGKLLKPTLEELTSLYTLNCGGKLSESTKAKLLTVSSSTIDRLCRRWKAKKGKSTTKPGSILRTEIPIQGSRWDIEKPGFVEADTVAHCGESAKGPFISSLTLTDIATQWTENRAIWSKSGKATLEAIRDMQKTFPFELKGFDSDNGSEFMNVFLKKYFLKQNINFTRSRPYRKNDNAHVEQKNWSHVRQLLGYGRFENPDLVPVLNELYKNYWGWYKNMFIPCMKLIEKRQVGSKIYRIHDKPMTPYQRVLNSPHVSEEKKQVLKKIRESLDPFSLKAEIDKRLQVVRRLASVSFEQWINSHPDVIEVLPS